MAQEEAYPEYFFTFWNNSAENKYHSNDSTATIWNYDLNAYNYYSYSDFVAEGINYGYVWFIS